MGVEDAPGAAGGGRRRVGDGAEARGRADTGARDVERRPAEVFGGAEVCVGGGLPQAGEDARAEALMRRALDIAAETPAGDVPVGAVILGPDGRELGRGVNRREADNDPTAHAEILAIREAVQELGDAWRLEDCTLVVTLEPCAMCAGALVGARIGSIIFGAYEPRTGACGSVWDVPRESPLHWAEVRGGVLAEECEELLRQFFARLR
ncbi:nucleoside deaminase [Corynebacterium jeikeium]|uniref:nucleoside deaminase n=1 Tax=Corynebacterium jeikeium TaxID=38289 RepID=UPI00087E076F|nr:tRNA-specific adenosine deaminase [Corynebacterium jeikeium]